MYCLSVYLNQSLSSLYRLFLLPPLKLELIVWIQRSPLPHFPPISLLEDGIPDLRIELAHGAHLPVNPVVVGHRRPAVVFRLLPAFVDVIQEFDVLLDVLLGLDDGGLLTQRVDVAKVVGVVDQTLRLPNQRDPIRHESVFLLDPLPLPLVVSHLVDVDVLQVVEIRRLLVDSRPNEPNVLSELLLVLEVIGVVPRAGSHDFRVFPVVSRVKLVFPSVDFVRRARHSCRPRMRLNALSLFYIFLVGPGCK